LWAPLSPIVVLTMFASSFVLALLLDQVKVAVFSHLKMV
jgi:hypothetical protein